MHSSKPLAQPLPLRPPSSSGAQIARSTTVKQRAGSTKRPGISEEAAASPKRAAVARAAARASPAKNAAVASRPQVNVQQVKAYEMAKAFMAEQAAAAAEAEGRTLAASGEVEPASSACCVTSMDVTGMGEKPHQRRPTRPASRRAKGASLAPTPPPATMERVLPSVLKPSCRDAPSASTARSSDSQAPQGGEWAQQERLRIVAELARKIRDGEVTYLGYDGHSAESYASGDRGACAILRTLADHSRGKGGNVRERSLAAARRATSCPSTAPSVVREGAASQATADPRRSSPPGQTSALQLTQPSSRLPVGPFGTQLGEQPGSSCGAPSAAGSGRTATCCTASPDLIEADGLVWKEEWRSKGILEESALGPEPTSSLSVEEQQLFVQLHAHLHSRSDTSLTASLAGSNPQEVFASLLRRVKGEQQLWLTRLQQAYLSVPPSRHTVFLLPPPVSAVAAHRLVAAKKRSIAATRQRYTMLRKLSLPASIPPAVSYHSTASATRNLQVGVAAATSSAAPPMIPSPAAPPFRHVARVAQSIECLPVWQLPLQLDAPLWQMHSRHASVATSDAQSMHARSNARSLPLAFDRDLMRAVHQSEAAYGISCSALGAMVEAFAAGARGTGIDLPLTVRQQNTGRTSCFIDKPIVAPSMSARTKADAAYTQMLRSAISDRDSTGGCVASGRGISERCATPAPGFTYELIEIAGRRCIVRCRADAILTDDLHGTGAGMGHANDRADIEMPPKRARPCSSVLVRVKARVETLLPRFFEAGTAAERLRHWVRLAARGGGCSSESGGASLATVGCSLQGLAQRSSSHNIEMGLLQTVSTPPVLGCVHAGRLMTPSNLLEEKSATSAEAQLPWSLLLTCVDPRFGHVARASLARKMHDLPVPPSPLSDSHPPNLVGETELSACRLAQHLPQPPKLPVDAEAAAREDVDIQKALHRLASLLHAVSDLPEGQYLLRKSAGAASWSVWAEGESLFHAATASSTVAASTSVPNALIGPQVQDTNSSLPRSSLSYRKDFDCWSAITAAGSDGQAISFVRPEWRRQGGVEKPAVVAAQHAGLGGASRGGFVGVIKKTESSGLSTGRADVTQYGLAPCGEGAASAPPQPLVPFLFAPRGEGDEARPSLSPSGVASQVLGSSTVARVNGPALAVGITAIEAGLPNIAGADYSRRHGKGQRARNSKMGGGKASRAGRARGSDTPKDRPAAKGRQDGGRGPGNGRGRGGK